MFEFNAAPCKDCTGRYIGCHSGCPTWQEWKTQEDARKDELRKARNIELGFMEARKNRDRRIMRKYHADLVSGHKLW